MMLPVVAALNILGLAMIHRLDLAEVQRAARNGGLAPQPDVYTQLTWTALGVVLFVAVLLVDPRPPHAAALHLHRDARRPRAAAAPARAGHRCDGQRRDALAASGRPLVPARRARQDPAHDLLRRLPHGDPRLARARAHEGDGHRAPARARPRPAARRLVRLARRARLRARPRHVAAVLRAVRLAALHRDPASQLARARRGPVRHRRGARLPRLRPRAAARRRVAAPVRRRGQHELPDRAVAVRVRERRHVRVRASVRATRSSCRTRRATSSSRPSARSSGSSGSWRCSCSTASSSSAACAPRSPAATCSGRCSPRACRSRWPCRCSWSSEGSAASSRSRVSPRRSSPRAARRSWPTGSPIGLLMRVSDSARRPDPESVALGDAQTQVVAL